MSEHAHDDGGAMATEGDRIQARLSPAERALVERAAAATGTSLSDFVARASVERAGRVLDASSPTPAVTVVAAEYFDRLQAALDEPDAVARLAAAAAGRRHIGRGVPGEAG